MYGIRGRYNEAAERAEGQNSSGLCVHHLFYVRNMFFAGFWQWSVSTPHGLI
jgi:hypothetical protein